MNIYLIAGGDIRMAKTYQLLKKQGEQAYLAWCEHLCREAITDACEVLDIVKRATHLVLPIPYTRDAEFLFTPASDQKIELAALLEVLQQEAKLFYGGTKTLPALPGIDLLADAEYQAGNAYLTARAIADLLEQTYHVDTAHSKLLITGYGKIAKNLRSLLAPGAQQITFAVRNPDVLAHLKNEQQECILLSQLDDWIGRFDCIINTVPAHIFSYERLCALRNGCPLIDIASTPFGFDHNAKRPDSKLIFSELSLPGRFYPDEEAENIYRIITSG